MPQYKVIYFDGRGAAEPIRQILTYAGQAFEDVRIPMGGLTQEKKEELKLPWGQVPVLEVDGKLMPQSFTIMRYLAKKYNIAGKTECEEFRVDAIVESARDLGLKAQPLLRAIFGQQLDKVGDLKKTFVEVDAPVMLKRFNEILEKGGNTWFVGTSLTYADIVFANTVAQFNALLSVQLEKDYPAITKLMEAINEEPKLKQWFEKRPKTAF